MTGLVRTRQNARIAAKVHAEQRRAAMSPEERERRQRQWDDPLFDGGLYWKQVWNSKGEVK